MSKKPHLTIRVANVRTRRIGVKLIVELAKFNRRYPDPDADEAAKSLDYLTNDFIFELCASTLAQAYIVVPGVDEASSSGGLEIHVENSDEYRSELETHRQRDEVETG